MAEAARNRLPSGYDEEFMSEVADDIQCLVCHLPSKEPVLTRCGHWFCQDCLEEYLRRQEQQGFPLTCPVDWGALDRDKDVFPDKAKERKILSLRIKCPSEGCEWIGELRAKENHLASCQLKAVSCTNQNCEVKVIRKDLTEHVTITCQWRVVKCDYCEEHHPQCLMETHQDTCGSFPTCCPNDCGTIANRDQLTNHIETSCPQTKVPCPYVWIGCHSEIRRGELESHLQLETRHHLELACCQLNDTQEEVKEKTRKLHSLEEKVKSCQKVHQQEINNLQNQLEEWVKSFQKEHQQVINNLQNQLEEKVRSCQKVHQREINKLQNQLQESENILRRRSEERINNLQTEMNETVNTNHNKVEKEINNGRNTLFCFIFVFVGVVSVFSYQIYIVQPQQINNVQESFERKVNVIRSRSETKLDEVQKTLSDRSNSFTWKITGFEYILSQAKKGYQINIRSDSFYILGYKLKLSIYPDGNGDGAGNHISIFIVIMKGGNDAILSWPFYKKVTIAVIDQQENANDRKNIVMFFETSPEYKECFGRPVTDENTGHGFPKFVSHKKLRERRYIVDDTIFIQVEAATP